MLKPNLNVSPNTKGAWHTNSKGIRGKTEYAYAKPADKARILVLGDSFTFGGEVNGQETYPYYLERMLRGVEVLNFGVSGYGHDQMLIYLKEEGIKYKPDIIILGFVASDVSRNMLEISTFPKPKFVLVHNELKLKNVPVPSVDSVLKHEFYKLKTVDLLLMLYDKYYFGIDRKFRESKQITDAILGEMAKTIQLCGAKPLFVYILTPRGVNILNRKEMIISENNFLQYCQDRGIPCLSTRAYFSGAIKKGACLKSYGHWDEQGNRIIARAISDYLRH